MDYSYFSHSRTNDKWQKISIKRRAGVVIPMFSIYSDSSIGIGEIPDLKFVVEWCKKTGMSIIQLLPLNDVGTDFAPYSSVSTFALDPMYLSLRELKNTETPDENELIKLKKKYRPLFGRVNYKIKKAKIDLLWKLYKSADTKNIGEFNRYIENNQYWLKDYALYKIIMESMPMHKWEEWNETLKHRNFEELSEIEQNRQDKIRFHCWMQWQLYEQMSDIKKYASNNNVLLMGDLPFLVSRESADVWSNQNYFQLDLSAGAPPDMYFAMGQKWGMPPYNWDNIANDRFVYLRERLKYAENFYDMYRIDHFVGLFRVWVSPANNDETPGNYMPKDEHLWELHGRKIIDEMINSTSMLPCAEDLGTVPECSYKVLQEYGIPGIDFQRYFKNNFYFKPPSDYRINSCSVVSTHDSTFWINWWQFEAGTIDKNLFELICQSANINYEHFRYAKSVLFDKEPSNHGRLRWSKDISSPEVLVNILQPPQDKTNDFIYLYLNSSHEQEKFLIYLDIYNRVDDNALLHRCLEKINQSNSIFSIQLIQEYLGLDEKLLKKIKRWNYRINTPGKVSKNNWSALLPVSLEGLLGLDVNRSIKKLIIKTGRSQT